MKRNPFDIYYKPQLFRDPECLYYSECLSDAAHKNGELNCSGCPRRKKSGYPGAIWLTPYCRLLYMIFFAEKSGHTVSARARDGLRAGSYVPVRDRP